MRKPVKATKTKRRKRERKNVEASSRNVFADIGFKDSEERLLKAKLGIRIAQLVEKKSWTQTQAAQRTALDQPKISRLLRGQLAGFSAERLFAIINRLGHSVEVRISKKERPPAKAHTRVTLS
jgi:predicted XRE-type DNA-binding protein